MSGREVKVAALLVLTIASGDCAPTGPVRTVAADRAAAVARFHRGVNFDHLGGFERALEPAAVAESLTALVDLGVTHVAITPSFFQRRLGDTEFYFRRDRAAVEADVRVAIRLARERGLVVLIKPHLWLDEETETIWRGRIDPTDSELALWGAAYREVLLGFARLAGEEGATGLSIGSELTDLAIRRPRFWRELILELRRVFPGFITYAANWDAEFDRITWWDAVDFIGVDAFWPLTASRDEPLTDAGCEARLRTIAGALRRVSEQYDKPVLVTEVGMKSAAFAAHRPWEWHEANAVDLELQATFYRGMAQVFAPSDRGRRWLAGVYIWKWYADLDWGGPRNSDFTPRGKPAERILRDWYRR